MFHKQTEAKGQVLAERGPEMGVPGPSCHRSSLRTPSTCLSLDAGSSCSLEMTGDSKAMAEPGLSQAPAPCAHPQRGSRPFPATCAQGFHLAPPHCLRGILGCQGGGKSTGRWHWSSHPARCVGIRGHLGSCFLEEDTHGSEPCVQEDAPAPPPSLSETLLPRPWANAEFLI